MGLARRIALQGLIVGVLTGVAYAALVAYGTLSVGQAVISWVVSAPFVLLAVAPISLLRDQADDHGPMYGPDYDPEQPWK